MQITDTQLSAQLEELKACGARSVNPCLTAQYIALSDQRVRQVFLQKIKQDYVFKGISCLNKVGIPENKYVYFAFECPPNIFCLVNPSFAVVVNFVDGYVVSIIDPYIPSNDSSPKLPPEIFKTWQHSYEEDVEDVRVYRPSGFNFPPTFFREAMTFKRNGEFLLTVPGPADVPELIVGTWQAETSNQIRVRFERNQREPFTLQIISIDQEVLKVRRI